MLHHFAHQAIDGSWHTVYRVPGTDALTSVMDAGNESAAQHEAERLNAEQRRRHEESAAAALHPSERRIPLGFYSDKEAA